MKTLYAFRRQQSKQQVLAKLTYLLLEEEKIVLKLKNNTYPMITRKYCKYLDKSEHIYSSFLDKTW